METGTAVWAGLLVALAVLAAQILVRTTRHVRRTRELEQFQQAVDHLAASLASVAVPLVESLDTMRRHAGDPDAVRAGLGAARGRLAALVAESAALRAPAGLETRAATVTAELGRAARAVDVVSHGLDALVAGRGDRNLEAETSLKRGTLNLRNASEAVKAVAISVRALRPADLGRGGRAAIAAGQRSGGTLGTYLVPDPEDDADPV